MFISSTSADDYVGKNGTHWSFESHPDREPNGEFDDSFIGPADHCRGIKTAREAFQTFLSPDIIREVVRCTNLNGERYSQTSNIKWKPVTENEMWSFISILIAAGRNKQNHYSIEAMWTACKAWKIDFYSFAMGKNRFKELFICLRFDDRETRAERFRKSNDKLEPIRVIFDIFVENCRKSYVPPCALTIDERLCLFRGK